jgi:hypothetical protein
VAPRQFVSWVSFFFLCETRQKAEKVRRLRGRIGLKGFVGVDSDGLTGGLALFWNDQIKVEVQSVCERYIDVHVRLSEDDPHWRLTCVYGNRGWRTDTTCGHSCEI